MKSNKINFWSGKRLIITGGAGFLGQRLVKALSDHPVKDIFVPRSKEYNLTHESDVKRLFNDHPADVVIHLAARVGGIGANQKQPGLFFYENIMMGVLMMEYARLSNVEKYVQVGTICAYPKFTKIPFQEKNLWDGYPEETNAPYGIAKKSLLVQAQAYRQQYNFNAIYLLPVNLYGPGDSFDLENSHVIPALVRKILEAKHANSKVVKLWGTGKATREFLYVDDAAKGILRATEFYNEAGPVNLGSGGDISIRDLATKIAKLAGYKGEFQWDKNRPDGQPRRLLDVSLAKKKFGFKSQVSLDKGLKQTIDWYNSTR